MSTLGARLNVIHGRLIAGSRTASLDLFREALHPVTGHVVRSVNGITEEEARDCAVSAIIGHVNNPASFESSKSSLWTYLCMIAMRDAVDALRQRLDRADLMKMHGYNIELWGTRANNEYDEIEWKKDAEKIMRLHGDYIVQSDAERRVLNLILEGERTVSAYAEALALDPASDVATEVKRVKDRINLRMRKVGDGL